MKVANAVAEILKREGIEFLIGYPVNPIIEAAAEADIRTIMVRQERIGLHMCDAIAKVTSGDRIGVFAMQHGPGTENAFGGVAQSFGDSCPVVVLPAGDYRDDLQLITAANNALHDNVTVPDGVEADALDGDLTLTGTVTDGVKLTGPHGTMKIKTSDGKVWDITLAPPARTSAAGLKQNTIPVGAMVTVHGQRNRDPSRHEMKTIQVEYAGKHYNVYPEFVNKVR